MNIITRLSLQLHKLSVMINRIRDDGVHQDDEVEHDEAFHTGEVEHAAAFGHSILGGDDDNLAEESHIADGEKFGDAGAYLHGNDQVHAREKEQDGDPANHDACLVWVQKEKLTPGGCFEVASSFLARYLHQLQSLVRLHFAFQPLFRNIAFLLKLVPW